MNPEERFRQILRPLGLTRRQFGRVLGAFRVATDIYEEAGEVKSISNGGWCEPTIIWSKSVSTIGDKVYIRKSESRDYPT